jgi:hypothetical protein
MFTRAGGVVVVALLVLGCSKRTDVPGQCLPLPGATRSRLTADPAGDALYWFEPVRALDFDAALRTYDQLVRFDLRTRELTRLVDHVRSPIVFTRDGIVVRRDIGDDLSLALLDHSGQVRSLLPDFMAPDDAEPIDDHTIAVLARGDAPRAVYVLDLDHPKPKFLIEADVLLSTSGTKVFTLKDDDGISVDLVTGEQRKFSVTPKLHPQGSDLWYVSDRKLHVRSMTTGADRAIVAPANAWKLVHERGQVLARTSQKDGNSQSLLLRDGAATTLAAVGGGVTVLEATMLGERAWALIGHNTGNYSGDIGDTNAEADVCVIAKSGVTPFSTRSIPERYLPREAAMFASLARLHPEATMQILDGDDDPTTVVIHVPERGGMDDEAMRRRARFFHDRVTSILGDREIRTDVEFADRRIARARWRRERLAVRTSAGMGPGMLVDLASYPLELQHRAIAKDGARITCAGTLVNVRPLPLVDVTVRCIDGDRKRVIAIGTLAPGGTAKFAESYEVEDGAEPNLEVFAHDHPIEYLDRVEEDRDRKVFELGVAVYDATQLAIDTQSGDDELLVELSAPADFSDKPEATRLAAVADAYQRLQALRSLYGYDDEMKLTLHVDVKRSTIAYDYDGEKLTLHD